MSGTQGWTHDEKFDDWGDVSTEPPAPLEPGIYQADIISAEPVETKKGDPAIDLQLMVTRVHGGPEGELKRKMFDKVTLTKEGRWRVKQVAQAAGVELPSSTGYEVIGEFCAALLEAQPIWLKSTRRTYEGKTFHNVDRYFDEAQLAEATATGGAGASGVAEPTKRKARRAG